MGRLRAVLVLAAVLAAACTSTSTEDGGACDTDVREALDRWAGAGFSAAVAVSGAADCLTGVGGEATPDTVFDIGSVTKVVTAATVMSLVEDGRLTLGDTAGRWLPELAGPAAGVTVEQLLAHTAGLAEAHGEDEVPMSLPEALAAIDGQALLFPPGTDSSYSNSGYTLLAAIAERAGGRPFRSLAAEVTTPRGGDRLGGFWYGEPSGPGDHWAVEGNGGMAFSARGLHDWAEALAGGAVLDPEGLDLMTRPLSDPEDGVAEGPGWAHVDAGVLGADGWVATGGGGDSGHEAVLAWFPDRDTIVVVLSDSAAVGAEELAQAIVPAVLAGEEIPAPVPHDDVDPDRLAAVAGTYALADGSTLDAEAHGDGLAVTASGGQALAALYPAPGEAGAQVPEHEAQAARFLAGESEDGRRELGALAQDLGPVGPGEVAGSGFVDGEIRTYLRIEAGGETVSGWVAFDRAGGLAAVAFGEGPPPRRFVAGSGGRFVPEDTTGEPDVSLGFDGAGGQATMVLPGGDELVGQRR